MQYLHYSALNERSLKYQASLGQSKLTTTYRLLKKLKLNITPMWIVALTPFVFLCCPLFLRQSTYTYLGWGKYLSKTEAVESCEVWENEKVEERGCLMDDYSKQILGYTGQWKSENNKYGPAARVRKRFYY